MTRATQGFGPDGRPLCFNGARRTHYVANNGFDADGRLQRIEIPWAFDPGCKSWAGHPGSDPVPLIEGWKCNGCAHFPGELVQQAVFNSLTRDA